MSTTNHAAATRFTATIEGMSCGNCVQAVTNALKGLPGVVLKSVRVGNAEFESAMPDASKRAAAALADAGFDCRVEAHTDAKG